MYDDAASRAHRKRIDKLVEDGKKLPIKTGFCLAGWHEATRPRDRFDQPVPTCDKWQTCPCDCHVSITQFYKESGKERVVHSNPDYTPVESPVNIFELVEAPSLLADVELPSHVMVSPAIGVVPGAVVKQFNKTPSGRAARGQLEAMVKEVTDTWVIENDRHPCTPDYVSAEIAKLHKIDAPNPVGIHAVFRRWEKMNFATIEVKPVRFTGYTDEGVQRGLNVLKDSTKRDKKRRYSMAF